MDTTGQQRTGMWSVPVLTACSFAFAYLSVLKQKKQKKLATRSIKDLKILEEIRTPAEDEVVVAFVRHGQALHNVLHLSTEALQAEELHYVLKDNWKTDRRLLDPLLTDLGREDAIALQEKMKIWMQQAQTTTQANSGGNGSASILVCLSPMARTLETGLLALRIIDDWSCVEFVVQEEIREWTTKSAYNHRCGSGEKMKLQCREFWANSGSSQLPDNVWSRMDAAIDRYADQERLHDTDGWGKTSQRYLNSGESQYEMYARAHNFVHSTLEQLPTSIKYVFCFSHGGFIREVEKLPDPSSYAAPPSNGQAPGSGYVQPRMLNNGEAKFLIFNR